MTSVHSHPHQNNYPVPPAQQAQPTAPTNAPHSPAATPATQSPAGSEAPTPTGMGSDESHTHTLPSASSEPNQVQFGSPTGPSTPSPQGSAPPEMQYQDIEAPAQGSEAPAGPPAEPESPENTPPSQSTQPSSPEAGEPETRPQSPQMQQLQDRFDRDGLGALNDPGVQALLQHVRDAEQKNFKSLIDMLQKSLDRAREQQEVNKKEYMQKTLPKIKQAEKEINELKALQQANQTRAALELPQ